MNSTGSCHHLCPRVGGVDAAYTAEPDGVKETLTLVDSQVPSTYRFKLKAAVESQSDLTAAPRVEATPSHSS
jgi:hypothetical protein